MINLLIYYIKKIGLLANKSAETKGDYAYRFHLFQELIQIYGETSFKGKRFLEIGPKDGEDTARLSRLEPSEYYLFDLPDKSRK